MKKFFRYFLIVFSILLIVLNIVVYFNSPQLIPSIDYNVSLSYRISGFIAEIIGFNIFVIIGGFILYFLFRKKQNIK